MQFRNLNPDEWALIDKAKCRRNGASSLVKTLIAASSYFQVAYDYRNKFTIAYLKFKRDIADCATTIHVGISKRNPKDVYSAAIGESVAFMSALRSIDPLYAGATAHFRISEPVIRPVFSIDHEQITLD